MNTQTQTHDTQIFSAMVEILVSSGLGEEDYGFTKNHHQTRYGELASVMNQRGFSNRAGKPTDDELVKDAYRELGRENPKPPLKRP